MYAYADLGLPVIPLCPADNTHERTSPGHKKLCKCNGKIPLITGWTNKSDTTEEEISTWCEQFHNLNFNVGLPMGSASGYIGIDIDGEEGEQLFQEMSQGIAPETWEYITGAGRRLLYQIPVGMKTKKVKQTGDGKHEECAILCNGQQTVLPPSKHYTGSSYVWKKGHSPQDLDCAMAPQWLLTLVKYEDKPTPTINLNQPTVNKFVVDMRNMSEEFRVTDFDTYIPAELADVTSEPIKVKNGSQSQAEEKSETEKILYQVISEGGRDNAMTQIVGHFLSKPDFRNMNKGMFMRMIQDYNQNYMDPPLEPESVEAKVNHLWEIEQQKTAEYKSNARGKRKFIPTDAAQIVLNKFKEQLNLVLDYDDNTGIIYTCNCNKGPWEPQNNQYETTIRANIRRFLTMDEFEGESDTKHRINETYEAIRDTIIWSHNGNRISFDLANNIDDLEKYIVVDGQLLDWKAGTLLPWDPNIKATYSFNVGYDPEAKCPHWLEYMEQWIPDKGSRNLVQEFFGYSLVPIMRMQIILFLDGSGSNGKSMLLDQISRIFGDTVSTLSTAKITERFGSSGLFNKLINICTEDEGDSNGFIKNTTELKSLSSGDKITAEYKGKDAFQFKNSAKLVFATNRLPRVKDKSHGWDRRIKIVKFPNKFKNDTRVAYEMEMHMKEETPGIFNWLLEGLRRLMDRGYFEDTEQLEVNKAEYKAVNDPIEGFLQEFTVAMEPEEYAKKKATGVSTTVLYALYEAWCQMNYGDKASSYTKVQKTFTQTIREKGIEKSRGTCVVKVANNQQADRQQVFFHIKPYINTEDAYEEIMSKFKDYGAMTDEGRLYTYFTTIPSSHV